MEDQDQRHANDLSRYIFPGSSGMIGICMTLVGLVKILEGGAEPRQADECVAVVAVVFFFSAVLSYLAIRTAYRVSLSRGLERAADVFFAIGLLGVVSVGILFAFDHL